MKQYIHGFNLITGNSYKALQRIFCYFEDWRYAWQQAKYKEFLQAGIKEDTINKILKTRARIDLEYEMEILEKNETRVLDKNEREYPDILKEISDPPFLLYCRGSSLQCNDGMVAIVGTRMPSEYGERITYKIAQKLAENGRVIVSGLAFGIDAIAHQATIQTGNQTVAVLPSSLSNITPSTHTQLAELIVKKKGTLISEYAPFNRLALKIETRKLSPQEKVQFFKYRFIERNRIIAGLCSAIIIIEAKERSGALITARHAFEQDRDVFALVGDITRPQAQGCLRLIAEDLARPITVLDKFLEELGINSLENFLDRLNEASKKIVMLLSKKPLSVEEIILKSKLSAREVNNIICQLEIDKLIFGNEAGMWQVTNALKRGLKALKY